MHLLNDCAAESARLAAARAACTSLCVRSPYFRERWGREELSRATDLCDAALRMIEGAAAADGDRGRAVLHALCERETMITALGLIEGVAGDEDRKLAEAVRPAGKTMTDVPGPDTVVAWAFPWLDLQRAAGPEVAR